MKSAFQIVCAAAVVAALGSAALAVNIETVPVGNPGNAADTRYETPGYGAVAYTYNIGKYEVTAGQYCEFLNAVAATDIYDLYNASMDSNSTAARSHDTATAATTRTISPAVRLKLPGQRRLTGRTAP